MHYIPLFKARIKILCESYGKYDKIDIVNSFILLYYT